MFMKKIHLKVLIVLCVPPSFFPKSNPIWKLNFCYKITKHCLVLFHFIFVFFSLPSLPLQHVQPIGFICRTYLVVTFGRAVVAVERRQKSKTAHSSSDSRLSIHWLSKSMNSVIVSSMSTNVECEMLFFFLSCYNLYSATSIIATFFSGKKRISG